VTDIAHPTATLTELIESWLRGVDDVTAANALVALGARLDLLAAATVRPLYPPGPDLVDWALTPEEFQHRAIAQPLALTTVLPPSVDPAWRLAVRGDFDLTSVVKKLLRSPVVASAFVAVDRPSGSLRRRPWRWPLRIGLAGFAEGTEVELWETFEAEHKVLPRLLDLTRIEVEPAAVDVLFVPGPLPSAIAVLHEYQPIANAVLVLTDAVDRWPVVASELTTARALTAAVAAGLVHVDDLLNSLTELVVELSHAKHFDVAVTKAFDRRVLLTAEPDGMARSALPETTRHLARSARSAARSAPMAAPRVDAAARRLDALADGMFAGESHEATLVVEPTEEIAAELAAVQQERWLQATVNSPGPTSGPIPGAFCRGRNNVAVFIGPEEVGAAAAPTPFDDSQLPWEEDAEAFRLTVSFVPLLPFGAPQEAELELTRFGRTPKDAPFVLDVPYDAGEVAARITVLFRNRVLQTAVLRGKVAEPVELADATAVLPTLSGLDDRRPFDVALLANHAAGVDALIRHSSGHTYVALKEAVKENVDALGAILGDAVGLRVRKGLDSPRARALLIALAQEGRDFCGNLGAAIGELSGAERIQLVTASSEWLLPIELVYERYAPLDNAKVCTRYLEGEVACGRDCAPVKDRLIVCPNAFWGLSKTIERHHFEPSLENDLNRRVLALKNPRSKRRTLAVDRRILATSKKVVAGDRKTTLGVLGAKATETIGWEAYAKALGEANVQLLVLMPHTDYTARPSMEIDGEVLQRSFIEPEYVTGDRDVDPVVVLFGCATSGNPDDPAGFASRFCEKGAAVVFHSSAQLLNTHAVALSQRLAKLLDAGGRSRPLSDLLWEFRSQAIRDGLLAAFAIHAFGDADWRI
jgi:hypothetical protein